jgi:hypothetical protein
LFLCLSTKILRGIVLLSYSSSCCCSEEAMGARCRT